MEEKDSFSIRMTNTVRIGGKFAAQADPKCKAINANTAALTFRIARCKQVKDHEMDMKTRGKPSEMLYLEGGGLNVSIHHHKFHLRSRLANTGAKLRRPRLWL